ncbi:c-type cytochrome [Campylobacter sputorum]|uniref:c-type cytochrome n=1 Tax=Campylobacter sputorum TaxID=206 RepID=UPI00053C0541|nr:c-type cytochrome [Campylobacter sputorum]
MKKFLHIASFLFLSNIVFATETYVIEAKGEFGKELQNLIQKYAKDQNVSINTYERSQAPASTGGGISFGVNTNYTYDVNRGEELYKANCFSCHGEKGTKRAMGTSKKLSQISAEEIESSFRAYQVDSDHGRNYRDLMRPVAFKTSNSELGSIIAYLKGPNALQKSGAKNENKDIQTTPTPQGSYLK